MVNPRTLLGAQELTVMLSGYLVGILTVQTYYYLRNSTGDPWVLKALVCFLWLTEFTCIVCMYHGFYIISILTPGPPKEVLSPTLTIAPLFLSSLNAPLTQAYFTYRLYRFSQKKWLAILLWMSSAILVVVVLLASTSMVLSSDREVWRQNWNGAYVSSMVLVAALDVIIAGCLCYYLYKSGRDQGTPTFRRTVKLVDGVILWTIQTGLLTSIVAVTAMTIFFADYNNCSSSSRLLVAFVRRVLNHFSCRCLACFKSSCHQIVSEHPSRNDDCTRKVPQDYTRWPGFKG
ncbi:hypothetical protein HGRIS_001808 [Hohenbuehelia grisea]|uniref:DUF6534 domain-containing protein n=1 Tax=Hohenbuehelia grisea TaxID=104357 RepID=A0ABR3JJT1_9AGAR